MWLWARGLQFSEPLLPDLQSGAMHSRREWGVNRPVCLHHQLSKVGVSYLSAVLVLWQCLNTSLKSLSLFFKSKKKCCSISVQGSCQGFWLPTKHDPVSEGGVQRLRLRRQIFSPKLSFRHLVLTLLWHGPRWISWPACSPALMTVTKIGCYGASPHSPPPWRSSRGHVALQGCSGFETHGLVTLFSL